MPYIFVLWLWHHLQLWMLPISMVICIYQCSFFFNLLKPYFIVLYRFALELKFFTLKANYQIPRKKTKINQEKKENLALSSTSKGSGTTSSFPCPSSLRAAMGRSSFLIFLSPLSAKKVRRLSWRIQKSANKRKSGVDRERDLRRLKSSIKHNKSCKRDKGRRRKVHHQYQYVKQNYFIECERIEWFE